MNRPYWTSRFSSTLSLLLLLACSVSASASELPLRTFVASYDLHKGDRHVGTTELRLQREGEHWRWSSLSRARGVYKLFTRKQPLIQTRFGRHLDGFRLHEIQIGDARNNTIRESALFNWDSGEMEVVRKGKHRQVSLGDSVYDYQSIHLLAANMWVRGSTETTIDFYRKGKLVKSRFAYLGKDRVDVNGQTVSANVYQQETSRSRSIVRYYYGDDNPLLPLRIETIEKDESPAVLILRQVDWEL